MKKNVSICQEECFHWEEVESARKEMLLNVEANQLAETFKVLGDPNRVQLLNALTNRELCVCDLAILLGMTSSAVSHQLRLLRNLRIVKYRREGKMVYYTLDDSHIENLFKEGLEHIRHS